MKKKIQTILEDRIDATKKLAKEFGLDIKVKNYQTYVEATNQIANIMGRNDIKEITKWSFKGLEAFVNSGKQHYVFGKQFYKALIESSKRTDLSKIPASFLINKEFDAYQVSLPDESFSAIIQFNHDEMVDEFNFILYFYHDVRWAIHNNEDDFFFYCFKPSKGQSCKEVIDSYFDEVNYVAEHKDKMKGILYEMFSSFVNVMLYLNNGQPDLREEKNLATNKYSRIQKGIKTKLPYTTVGFSFKKETLVNGFFRWQPYGPNNSLRRYQFIEGFPRGGNKG